MWTLLRRLSGRLEKPSACDLTSDLGRIRLVPIQPHQTFWIERWFQDSESCRLAFGIDADTETLRKIAEEYLAELLGDRSGVYLIHLNGSLEEQPIGFLRYRLYRRERRKTARVGIMLGPETLRGKGLGTEAMETLLNYLFATRAVDLVELDTATFNQGARRCFEKCGFQTLREMEVVRIHSGDRDRRYLMRLERGDWRQRDAKSERATLQR